MKPKYIRLKKILSQFRLNQVFDIDDYECWQGQQLAKKAGGCLY